MGRLTTEAHLDRLAAEGGWDEAIVERGLRSRRWVVVMKAAQRIRHEEHMRPTVEAELVGAFHRLMVDLPKSDPGCHGKRAIMQAFERCDGRAWEVFLAGVEHIQMEPVWGGREDTAGPLRASSARCLVQARYPRTLDLLAVLLADALPEPRLTAASLIPSAGVPGGASVLRLKLLHGDTHPEVTTACTTALLELDPDDGLDFVVHRLLNGGDQEQAEAVAMGLGESRLPKAVTPLIEAWPLRVEPGWRRHIFACLVLLRQQTAYDHLLELLNGDSDPVASDVAHTLAPVIAHDPRLAAQLRAQLAHVPSRARRLLLLELLGDME